MTVATRFAFALAAGLWIGLSGMDIGGRGATAWAGSPAGAEPAAAPSSATRKHKGSHRAEQTSAKPVMTTPPAAAAGAALPEVIANAQAQIPAGAPAASAPESPFETGTPPAAETHIGDTHIGDARTADVPVVDSDQLNELDLAATDAPQAHPSPAPKAAVSKPSLWDQTSLIGKVFIAFGGLLMVASAARLAIT